MQSEDTAVLVRAAAAGEQAAWKALVERFSGLVWSVARGHGLRGVEAEEVFQTTWFRLAEHLGRINDPARLGGWLASTARHEAFRTLRAGRRVSPAGDLEPLLAGADHHSPEAELLAAEAAAAEAELNRQLWLAFQELSGRCRQLLRALLATPPPSYAEIAEAYEMPIGSIGPTRARCLRRLRELLAERGITQHLADS